VTDMPWRSLRAASKAMLSRKIDLTVEGIEHLPENGPVVLAARHFHHLYDGVVLLATIPRPIHVVVTTDWVEGELGKKGLGALCKSARWPVVVRTDPFTLSRSKPDPDEPRIFRKAARDSVSILKDGRILLIFPEGYPTVDPNPTPKSDDSELLPFQSGFVRFAQMAERGGAGNVPIVPVGLEYERGPRWRVTIRFGPAVPSAGKVEVIRAGVEDRVRALSGLSA